MSTIVRGANESGALFSECGRYRYELWRVWDPAAWPMIFIGLNPSTADESVDDPTIRRVIGYAKREKYGGIVMLNAFALRSTDPRVMLGHPEPVGPDNDAAIARALGHGRFPFDPKTDICSPRAQGGIVAGWGNLGRHLRRDLEIQALCKEAGVEPVCLGMTGDCQPIHPLYQPANKEFVPLVWAGL